ncbi:hypothetical protein JHD46_05400 [Sulfurimonas sp. SAG-AH-194-C20]|nr:hypothetical protein [Sulfurimonas sp. SAG-AH-194-C20]MDF1879075.1 hypothetical protein [Sulfurimonas sp. SAG-AH-194-C20]
MKKEQSKTELEEKERLRAFPQLMSKDTKMYYAERWTKVCYYYEDFDAYLKEVHDMSPVDYELLPE